MLHANKAFDYLVYDKRLKTVFVFFPCVAKAYKLGPSGIENVV